MAAEAITVATMVNAVAVGIVVGCHSQSGRLPELLLLTPITGLHLFITYRNMVTPLIRKLLPIAQRTDFTIHKLKRAPVVGKE